MIVSFGLGPWTYQISCLSSTKLNLNVVAETFTKYVFYLNLTILVGIIYCASQCNKVLYKNHRFSIEIHVKALFLGRGTSY